MTKNMIDGLTTTCCYLNKRLAALPSTSDPVERRNDLRDIMLRLRSAARTAEFALEAIDDTLSTEELAAAAATEY
jgi:hypothetical protein